MTTSDPLKTVQSIYADFGRGDIAALIARLHPDVEVIVHAPDSIPYAGTRRGPGEVGGWFGEIGSAMALDRLEVETMIASGDVVAVRGVEGGKAVATGRSYESGFAHFWTLKDGLVLRMDDFMNSAALAAAVAA